MPVDSTHVEVLTGRRPKQIKILLLAYYRSGSTYTSELFRNHPDAIYLWVFVMLSFSKARLLNFYFFFRETLKLELPTHIHWTAMNCFLLLLIFILLCTCPYTCVTMMSCWYVHVSMCQCHWIEKHGIEVHQDAWLIMVISQQYGNVLSVQLSNGSHFLAALRYALTNAQFTAF